jgi:exodeoxyribonuclease VII large subunit
MLKKILIITSENGAALQDFLINLENNKLNIDCDIKNVMVQGPTCPDNICKSLKKLKKSNIYYDLVVITRGGGSFEDLFGFSQPELIEVVHNFHLPILSAIGHQIDNPLLDLVADITTPTPSLAAQFIVDHNKRYLSNLQEIKNKMKCELLDNLNECQYISKKLNEKVYYIFNRLKNEYQNLMRNEINDLILKYSILESKILVDSSQSISLYNNNIKLNTPEELELLEDSIIKLKWNNKEFKIKIFR